MPGGKDLYLLKNMRLLLRCWTTMLISGNRIMLIMSELRAYIRNSEIKPTQDEENCNCDAEYWQVFSDK